MLVSRLNKRSNLLFIIFYLTFLFVGFSIYRDYGLSWDEPISRDNNGIVNYEFIHTGNYQQLITSNEKYHGPAFEILLIYIERVCNLKNTNDIYHMRHLVTLITFAVSVVFFYLLLMRVLYYRWVSVLGCVFLVLSPRIFAESFYNSKDLVFLSFIIINLYTTISFLKRKNISTAFFHAIISAIVIDVRILGIIIPAFTLFYFFIDFLRYREQRKKIISSLIVYFIFLVFFLILFWPVLWHQPLNNLILAWKEMRNYPWSGKLFYLGKLCDPLHLPWHYIPVWIIISTPVLFSLLFIAGIYFLIMKVIAEKRLNMQEWLHLYVVLIPICAIIVLHSVVYDGWRHVYFIYPSILAIALVGFENILFRAEKVQHLKKILVAGTILYCFQIGMVMASLHPYENVYFNFIAGNSLSEAREKFETDYWGLSYKDGLKHILESDTSGQILVCPSDKPGIDNVKMFPEKEQARLSFTQDYELADYFITVFRNNAKYKYKGDYNIVRDNGVVLSVFDLRKKKISLIGEKYKVDSFSNSFEAENPYWSAGQTLELRESYEGKHVGVIDSTSEFGAVFSYHPPEVLTIRNNARNYLSVNLYLRASVPFAMRIVFELDSGNAKVYEYEAQDIRSSIINTWIKKDFKMVIPNIISTNDIIKIYIWNLNHNYFMVDNMNINFYSIPRKEVEVIRAKLP